MRVLYLLGSIIIILLYPRIHPLAGIKQTLDRAQIKASAQEIADELNFPTENYRITTSFVENQELIRQAQQVLGLEKSMHILREELPGYFWQIRWRKIGDSIITMQDKSEDEISTAILGDLSIKLDMHGNLFELTSNVADSIRLPFIDASKAKIVAGNFIKRFSTLKYMELDTLVEGTSRSLEEPEVKSAVSARLKLEDEIKTIKSNRTDYQYTYSTMEPHLNDKIQVSILVSGNIVTNFDVKYIISDEYESNQDVVVTSATKGLAWTIIVVLFLVVGFKRMRAFEIGFKMAIILGLLVAVSHGLEIYLQKHGDSGWELLLEMLVGPLLIGGAFVIIWAVSEPLVREMWKEKFTSMDLLTNGHFLHSRVGEGILRGVSLGIALLAGWLLLLWLSAEVAKPFISTIRSGDNFLSNPNHAIFIINQGINNNIFKAVVFLVFVVSFVRRRVSSPILLIASTAMIWGLTLQGDVKPWFLGIPIEILLGGLIVWTFIRFDFLSSFIVLGIFTVWYNGAALFYFQNEAAVQSGYGLIACNVLLIVFGIIAISTKDRVTDFDSITPAFVRHITERQRLQGEFAIAREVQMSFLPEETPKLRSLEIASKCIPAYEVGGDYYDFFELGENKLGVVIGDVSGKGTQAAFYMTLTKGFLKALVKSIDSPADLLIQMNNLFYENVKRGHFISVLFAIFDVTEKTLTLARAGHNPLILRRVSSGKVEFFNQPGIALGLEKGDICSQSIKDETIPLNKGDLFVFYTDGFTEAMSKTKDEFGEERLVESIEKYSTDTAPRLMEGVFADVKRFIGRAQQQDDMTIVIVKIT